MVDENDTSSNNGETYDSASNKDEPPDTSSDILALPLSEAYAYAVKQYEEHAEHFILLGLLAFSPEFGRISDYRITQSEVQNCEI